MTAPRALERPGEAQPADPEVALALRHVHAERDGRAVLRGVELEVRRGELVLLLGASGSGKSTLLRLLNRLEEPSAGDIYFRGAPLTSYEPRALRRSVALLMQTPILFPGSVRENLSMVPHGYAPASEQRMLEEIQSLGLAEALLEREATQLSGGEKQRVSLARSLLCDPEILLLDEPTSALDPHHEAKVAQLINELRSQRQLTCVVVTHSERLSQLLDGRLVLLHDGVLDAAPSSQRLRDFFSGGEP